MWNKINHYDKGKSRRRYLLLFAEAFGPYNAAQQIVTNCVSAHRLGNPGREVRYANRVVSWNKLALEGDEKQLTWYSVAHTLTLNLNRHILKGRIKYTTYHGPSRHDQTRALQGYDIVLTTYEVLRQDFAGRYERDTIYSHTWHRVVLDEGQPTV